MLLVLLKCQKDIINNYCKYIKKFETKEISLISYDNFNPQTTFYLTPDYFEKELNILWKKTLIEDDNRKLIYLTSGLLQYRRD